MRRMIALGVAAVMLTACNGARAVELACESETLRQASFDPDRSQPGFPYPKDALAILSWSRGTPMLESSGENEVVFVYVEDSQRVGAAFVVRGSKGWWVDELWTCPE